MTSVIASIEASALRIPFRQAFAHASASRAEAESAWVVVRTKDGFVGLGEGCPREYVTGETLEGALAWIGGVKADVQASVTDAGSLAAWVGTRRADIDRNPAAWCALELAILDAMARRNGRTVEAELGLEPLRGAFTYSAVLGASKPARFAAELERYRAMGFRAYKVKLDGDADRDRERVAALRAAGIAPDSARADANNAWRSPDEAITGLEALRYPFHALEEPIAAGDVAGLERVARALGAAIILDESLLNVGQIAGFARAPDLWRANLRVSKMGGLLRSLDMVERLRRAGIRLVVGAHVGETSVLTRAALTVAAAAKDLLVAQEGAFGTHLLEHDAVEPCLMFGPGGEIDAGSLPAGDGFGLRAAPTS